MTPYSKRITLIALGVAVVLVAVVAFAATRSSSSSSASGASGDPSTTSAPGATSDPTGTDPSGPSASDDPATSAPDPGVVPPTTAPPALPLNVTVSSTSGLGDAQPVNIHVTPKDGSDIYGVEVFVCAPDTTYTLDADIRPSLTGKCISKRLSPNSLDYLNKGVAPPYQSADISFPVGVGSDHYTTQRGQDVTITCGPGHPCTLVLKLQIPNGYGFLTYPLTFR